MMLAFIPLLILISTSNALEQIVCQNGTVHHNTEEVGEIFSPGYLDGKKYPNDVHCEIELQPPSTQTGKKIKITFIDFDLESTTSCGADYLEISTETLYPRPVLCGRAVPGPLIADKPGKLKISFVSDFIRNAKGFRIKYETTNLNTVCESEDQLQCTHDRRCVSSSAKCNGKFDCMDGTDEENCNNKPDLIPNKKQCGFSPVDPDFPPIVPRIVDGQEAVPHSWPWQVSLGVINMFSQGHYCGGSLINNYWVVTAGHCLFGAKTLVRLGAHDLNFVSENEQWRETEKVIRHQNFSNTDMSYDIGLIKLKIPVNYTDTVQPVCLPENSKVVVAINKTCYISGWGSTRGSGFGSILKQTDMHVAHPSNCSNSDPDLGIPYVNPDSIVCATNFNTNAGPCHGDSGGPFVCKSAENKWELHGATSFGTKMIDFKMICGMGSYTVWNRVAYHIDWINEIINKY